MMASFAIHTPYARRYIQNGLKRARELQDETLAMMRENANAREHQQAGLWEQRQTTNAHPSGLHRHHCAACQVFTTIREDVLDQTGSFGAV